MALLEAKTTSGKRRCPPTPPQAPWPYMTFGGTRGFSWAICPCPRSVATPTGTRSLTCTDKAFGPTELFSSSARRSTSRVATRETSWPKANCARPQIPAAGTRQSRIGSGRSHRASRCTPGSTLARRYTSSWGRCNRSQTWSEMPPLWLTRPSPFPVGAWHLEFRRQGAVYVLHNTTGTASLTQVDAWHEATHPSYWQDSFVFEAELHASLLLGLPAGCGDGH